MCTMQLDLVVAVVLRKACEICYLALVIGLQIGRACALPLGTFPLFLLQSVESLCVHYLAWLLLRRQQCTLRLLHRLKVECGRSYMQDKCCTLDQQMRVSQ